MRRFLYGMGAALVLTCGTGLAESHDDDGTFDLTYVRSAKSTAKPDFYANLELRHYTNTYYDRENYYQRQDPSFHVIGRFGSRFHNGALDAYATAGFIKVPGTRKVIQRRPELELDYYPLAGIYGQIVQYNVVELPTSEDDFDPTISEPSSQGTVYTVGVAPLFKYPINLQGAGLTLKAGVDVWTKLYSRRQYVDSENADDHSGYFLKKAEAGEPVEDYAPHYFSQAMVGFSLSPGFARNLTAELNVVYQSDFPPIYEYKEGSVRYHYGAERTSYYKARLYYAIDSSLSLVNDFYHYHEGFFEANRRGQDNRRFRNIVSLVCRL